MQDAAVLALAAGALRTRVWPRVAGTRGRGRGLQHQLEPGRARVTRPLELHGHRAGRAHGVAATWRRKIYGYTIFREEKAKILDREGTRGHLSGREDWPQEAARPG